MSRKRVIPPITWTILCFLLLAVGATPYAKTANIILIIVRLVFIVVVSVLAVMDWWKYYQCDPHWSNVPDGGSTFLRKLRGWALDEQPRQQQSPASQIVQGGCYQTPPNGTPPWRAAEIVTIILVVLVIAAFTLWRK